MKCYDVDYNKFFSKIEEDIYRKVLRERDYVAGSKCFQRARPFNTEIVQPSKVFPDRITREGFFSSFKFDNMEFSFFYAFYYRNDEPFFFDMRPGAITQNGFEIRGNDKRNETFPNLIPNNFFDKSHITLRTIDNILTKSDIIYHNENYNTRLLKFLIEEKGTSRQTSFEELISFLDHFYNHAAEFIYQQTVEDMGKKLYSPLICNTEMADNPEEEMLTFITAYDNAKDYAELQR